MRRERFCGKWASLCIKKIRRIRVYDALYYMNGLERHQLHRFRDSCQKRRTQTHQPTHGTSPPTNKWSTSSWSLSRILSSSSTLGSPSKAGLSQQIVAVVVFGAAGLGVVALDLVVAGIVSVLDCVIKARRSPQLRGQVVSSFTAMASVARRFKVLQYRDNRYSGILNAHV